MNAIRWLEQNAAGFIGLTEQERAAPMQFSLLWSYFEAEALGASGSSNAIAAWVRELSSLGKLRPAAFEAALDYFKGRYFSQGDFTANFHGLNLRQNDHPALVRAVISGQNHDQVDSIVALFIIIYRFRNNYFHGPKWAYSLHDQLQNFNFANSCLMEVMDMRRS